MASSSVQDTIDILLLGSGGREHALARALASSPRCGELYVAPGNGGTLEVAQNVELNIQDPVAVADFAVGAHIDLVVIGPEAPLVAGVADAVRAAGVAVFGPGAQGAQIEGSKLFSKQLMERAGVPTAGFGSFTNEDEALAYVRAQGAPLVVKADGLAAGKGVVVATSLAVAEDAVRECFAGAFGEAGSTVVIEEMLTGPECSLLAFVDGRCVRPMAPSQDHKRALEGDQGPNTGGMGVYSPVPIVEPDEHECMIQIMQAVANQLADEGIDYQGCLYGGFMLTPQGPQVLEFNARFGDPETQVIVPRLTNDLLEVLLACAEGRLSEVELSWSPDWAVSVVLASAGYPGAYETGKPILGIDEAEALDGVTVYHAGTAMTPDNILVTNGGRVLNVTALASSFEEARERAYAACACISFEGKTLRTDIGLRALQGRSAWEDASEAAISRALVLGDEDDRDTDLRETLCSEERSWSGRMISVDTLGVRLPNGRMTTREVVRHPGAAAVVALTETGKIALVRQYRTALDQVTVEIPAGKLDPGEDPEDCARRELLEETGFVARRLRFLTTIATSAGFCDELIHIYMATGLELAEACPDEDEFLNVDLVPLPELIDAVLDGKIQDAKTVVGALACDAIAHRL